MTNEFLSIEGEIIDVLKTVFDPEIPVNIYDLGLIYEVNVNDDGKVIIVMTLTSPNCPVAESMPQEVYDKVSAIDGVMLVYGVLCCSVGMLCVLVCWSAGVVSPVVV